MTVAFGYATPRGNGTFQLAFNGPDPRAYFPSTYSYVLGADGRLRPGQGGDARAVPLLRGDARARRSRRSCGTHGCRARSCTSRSTRSCRSPGRRRRRTVRWRAPRRRHPPPEVDGGPGAGQRPRGAVGYWRPGRRQRTRSAASGPGGEPSSAGRRGRCPRRSRRTRRRRYAPGDGRGSGTVTPHHEANRGARLAVGERGARVPLLRSRQTPTIWLILARRLRRSGGDGVAQVDEERPHHDPLRGAHVARVRVLVTASLAGAVTTTRSGPNAARSR